MQMQVLENNTGCFFVNEIVYCNALRVQCRSCSVYKSHSDSLNNGAYRIRGHGSNSFNHD